MAAPDHLRAEQGLQLVKVFFRQQLVHRVDARKIQKLHALRGQSRRHLAVERLKLLFLPRGLSENAVDLLARGQAGQRLGAPRPQQVAVHQTADAHHVKLVQIRAVDGQKPQPVIQRQACVRRLLHHAAVECQPAQLAVEKQPRAGRVRLLRRKQAAAVLLRHLPQRVRAGQRGLWFSRHVHRLPFPSNQCYYTENPLLLQSPTSTRSRCCKTTAVLL